MESGKIYHFVATNEMKNEDIQYSVDKWLSVIKTIVYVINIMLPIVDCQYLMHNKRYVVSCILKKGSTYSCASL